MVKITALEFNVVLPNDRFELCFILQCIL